MPLPHMLPQPQQGGGGGGDEAVAAMLESSLRQFSAWLDRIIPIAVVLILVFMYFYWQGTCLSVQQCFRRFLRLDLVLRISGVVAAASLSIVMAVLNAQARTEYAKRVCSGLGFGLSSSLTHCRNIAAYREPSH
jgi:hypothetical protein